MTYVTLMIIKACGLLNVPPEFEEKGLDQSDHGEAGYDFLPSGDNELEKEIVGAKLCAAAAAGDVPKCRQLATRAQQDGIDPAHPDVDGRTPLHLAAAAGNLD